MEDEYFTKQILTYMGNKRKFLNKIDEIITLVKTEIGEKNIDIAEGFSGSGIVSRLFKNRVMNDVVPLEELKTLYVNDMAGYSKTLNECYLTSTTDLTTDDYENLILHKKKLQTFLSKSKIPKSVFLHKYETRLKVNQLHIIWAKPSIRIFFIKLPKYGDSNNK